MVAAIRIDSILAQISQLGPEAHAEILRRLTRLRPVKKAEVVKPKKGLLQLESLGSEVWKGVDIDRYVAHERQWD